MPRSKSSSNSNRQKKKIFKEAKGFFGNRKDHYRIAKDAVVKKHLNEYKGRKQRKRIFRSLWIARINAGVRKFDMSYSRFIEGLAAANIDINRKTLSELAINDSKAFEQLIEAARKALAEKASSEKASSEKSSEKKACIELE